MRWEGGGGINQLNSSCCTLQEKRNETLHCVAWLEIAQDLKNAFSPILSMRPVIPFPWVPGSTNSIILRISNML